MENQATYTKKGKKEITSFSQVSAKNLEKRKMRKLSFTMKPWSATNVMGMKDCRVLKSKEAENYNFHTHYYYYYYGITSSESFGDFPVHIFSFLDVSLNLYNGRKLPMARNNITKI